MTKHDAVNHPSHYARGSIETIDFIRAKLGPDGFVAYCLGNVVKYVSRAGHKDDLVQDLSKARVYLTWAIETASEAGLEEKLAAALADQGEVLYASGQDNG